MHLRNPLLATLLGGLLLGVSLRAVMPTTPLPPPEPAWRKSGAAMVEPVFSAQTFEAQAAAYGHTYVPAAAQPSAAGFVPHPYEETLAYARKVARTPYDDLPRYEEPAADEAQAPETGDEGTTVEYVELPVRDVGAGEDDDTGQ